METPPTTYRYPGTKPFERSERNIFFGRKTDIANLIKLVELERLMVLFSKSGLGKSSLMNAGVVPELEDRQTYQSSRIRFFAYTDGDDKNILQKVKQSITQSDAKEKTDFFDKLIPEDNSLWKLLKKQQIATDSNKTFLLVFDQAEELFTYPDESIEEFKKDFAEMLYTNIPQRYLHIIENHYDTDDNLLNDQQIEWLEKPIPVRVVIVIRYDRMSLLSRLNDYLPTIIKITYELKALTPVQTTDAILEPAKMKSKEVKFDSKRFSYSDDAIKLILSALTKNNTQPVETFQLQIICRSCENLMVERRKNDNKQISENQDELELITPSDLGDIEEVFKNYITGIIDLLPVTEQLMARKFIEEELIVSGTRVSLPDTLIFDKIKLKTNVLEALVNSRIIRAEPNSLGGISYEISHDTLVPPILDGYEKRKKEDQRIAAELELAEKQRIAEVERKAAEFELAEKLRKEEEERRIEQEKLQQEIRTMQERRKIERRRQITIVAIVTIASIISLSFAIYAFKQKNIAEEVLYENYINQADRAFKNDKLQESIDWYAKALKLKPDSTKLEEQILKLEKDKDNLYKFKKYISDADSLFKKGAINQAFNLLTDAKNLNYNTTFVIEKIEKSKESFVKQWLNDALVLIEAEELTLAFQILKQAESLSPDNVQIQNGLKKCQAGKRK